MDRQEEEQAKRRRQAVRGKPWEQRIAQIRWLCGRRENRPLMISLYAAGSGWPLGTYRAQSNRPRVK